MTSQTSHVLDDENPAADEWYGPEDPPEASGPGPEPAPGPDAPHGWVIDKATKTWRPKLSPGRPRKPLAADELAARPPVAPPADEPPADVKGRRKTAAAVDVPMPKGGVIAAGVNRLYRSAGRILALADVDLGMAVVACTQTDPDDPGALTTGEAWENLARNNPRVRAWLLKVIQGNDWQALAMAHLPIGLALVTKQWVRNLMPGSAAPELFTDDGEDGGLTADDVGDMQAMAQEQAHRIAQKMGVKVPPAVAEAAMAEAQRRAANGEPPPMVRRQTGHSSRAKRRGR